MCLTTTPTFETVTYEEFLSHYGFLLGCRLVYDFNEAMREYVPEYDGDTHPEYLDYVRTNDGFYWIRWNDRREGAPLYTCTCPSGCQISAPAEALSMTFFSTVLFLASATQENAVEFYSSLLASTAGMMRHFVGQTQFIFRDA